MLFEVCPHIKWGQGIKEEFPNNVDTGIVLQTSFCLCLALNVCIWIGLISDVSITAKQ